VSRNASHLTNEIKAALEQVDGLGMVLVIGAGSSLDDPTGLELGGTYSREAHAALTRRGIIATQANPEDLSELADSVVAATGNQDVLVAELPIQKMRLASPNSGHKVAAALQADGFVKSILTLNYDTAMATAISALGIGGVHVVERAADLPARGAKSLIYLHGSANGPSEDLVLTSSDLDSTWQGGWKDLVASQTMFAPVVAFVGLGSSAKLISSTLQKIVAGVGARTAFALVGPGDQSRTTFASSIGADAAHCISCGWTDFMFACGDYALGTLLNLVTTSFDEIERQRTVAKVDLAHVLQEIERLGYLRYGAVRANWFGVGHRCNYMTHPGADSPELVHLADLIHFVGEIEAWTASQVRIVDGDLDINGACVSLYSSREPADFETAVTRVQSRIDIRHAADSPVAVVIARTSPPVRVAAPANILVGGQSTLEPDSSDDFDIIRSRPETEMFYLPDVRNDPAGLIGAIG
jgi:hypothetical protein